MAYTGIIGSDDFQPGQIVPAMLLAILTTTGLAPVSVESSSAVALVQITTGTAPVGLGSSSASSLVVATTGTAPATVASTSTSTLLASTTGLAPVNVSSSSAATDIPTGTTTGLAPVTLGSTSTSTLTATTTGTSPIDVSSSSASANVPLGTTTGTAPVSVGSSSTVSLVATTTGAAPVSVGSTSAVFTITTTTGSAPVDVGSSSAAQVVDGPTTGFAPVAVGSSSSVSLIVSTTSLAPVSVGSTSVAITIFTTTGTAPVDVASSSAASTTITLTGWTADQSQQTSLELDVATGVLIVDLPLPVPPPLVVPRMLRRQSHVMPSQAPGADRQSDPWEIIEADVGVLHVVVGGQDVTYFRGSLTVVDSWSCAQPFGDASAQIRFPQQGPFDVTGTGEWAWLHEGASVEIFILDADGTTRHRRFAGHFINDEGGHSSDDSYNVWQAEGALFQADHEGNPVPTKLLPTDIGTLIPRSLNGVVSRRYGALSNVTTGIPSRKRGQLGDSPIDYSSDLLGTAQTNNGATQWTVAKVPNTHRQYVIRTKDRTTVHHTITAGAPGLDIALTSDLLSTVNVIMGRGIAPNGYAWMGTCYPNFIADGAPPFPFTNPDTVITVGMSDSDTDSGDGVSTWQRRAVELGHRLVVDGTYNDNDRTVCLAIQRSYGILADGIIGGQTWTATFEVGSGGGDLSKSYRRPLWILPEVDPHLYSADGAIVGDNPAYDPTIMRFKRDEDFGAGFTRADGVRSATAEGTRDKNIGLYGTITLTSDPHGGSKWLINEGENIRVLGYKGRNVLLHIAQADYSPDSHTVTLTVDEHARDAMTVASIVADRRDAKADPARRPGSPTRRSGMDSDLATPYDGESPAGVIPKHAIHEGLWNVIRIPISQVGRIAKLDIRTSGPAAPFVVAFFAQEITPNHLASLVGNPLSGSDAFNKTEAQAKQLDDLGLLEAIGTEDDPCGYWPGHKGSHSLNGILIDKGGIEYESLEGEWIWVAEYSEVSTFIQGRAFPAQMST